MTKKLLYLLLTAIATFAMVSCTPSADPHDDPDALTIVGKVTDMAKPYMTEIFNLYEKNTGKALNVIKIKDDEFEVRAKAMFDSGDAPDILMHFHNADLNAFDEDDFYFLDDETWVSDLTPSADAYCRDKEGRLVGLPFWESSVSGCYYNKTILSEMGLEAPTTQSEFDNLCNALLRSGKTPICWSTNSSWMYQFPLDPVFYDKPENLEKINTNAIKYADIPEVRSMTEWIANAESKGWFGKDHYSVEWGDIGTRLASGEAVMTFIWDTWFYTDFTPAKYTVSDFALMPVFMNTVDEGTYEGGNLNMMMVNRNSEKLDLALDFLEFCATPENYNKAFDGISTVNCFKGMTTNIQSQMVIDAKNDIAQKERVSTAASKIIGYSADDMMHTFTKLFRKTLDVDGCINELDSLRITKAHSQGIVGF